MSHAGFWVALELKGAPKGCPTLVLAPFWGVAFRAQTKLFCGVLFCVVYFVDTAFEAHGINFGSFFDAFWCHVRDICERCRHQKLNDVHANMEISCS